LTIFCKNKNSNSEIGIYLKYLKRFFDFVSSLMGIVILIPVLIIISILVKFNLGSPIFFKQERPGENEKTFTMYKFRTMKNFNSDKFRLLPDSKRLTKFGKFLRASSLDELPGLFNVLKGNMSLVGPRPLSIKYLPFYTDEERNRHSVKPGLTGLAQVNGRNSITWEEKFAYDIMYIQKIRFYLDVSIIFKTIYKVIIRSNIGQAEEAPKSLHIIRKNFIGGKKWYIYIKIFFLGLSKKMI